MAVACKAAPHPSTGASTALTSTTVAPYFPDPGVTAVTTRIGDFQVSRCGAEERTVVLWNGTKGAKTDLQIVADRLNELVAGDPPGRSPIKVGACCDKPGPLSKRDCVWLDISLCAMTIEQTATLFARALSDVSFEGQNVGLRIVFQGMTGPPRAALLAR